MTTIYQLIRSDSNLPIYVGKTDRDPIFREKEHKNLSKNPNSSNALYVHKCIANEQIDYYMKVIATCNEDDTETEYSVLVDTLTQDNDLRNVKMGDKDAVEGRYAKAVKDSNRIKQLHLKNNEELKEYDITAKGITSAKREITKVEKEITRTTRSIVGRWTIDRASNELEKEIELCERENSKLEYSIRNATKDRDERIISLAERITREHTERTERLRGEIELYEREETNATERVGSKHSTEDAKLTFLQEFLKRRKGVKL